MEQRTPPQTEEGWYVLHDCRHIDWDAWRAATQRERETALSEGIDFLSAYEGVEDAEEGQTAVYTVMGHKADLMILHLRPTMADLDAAQRHFERTALAEYTDRAFSYTSVTEASGYTERAREYFEGEVDDDSGLAQYIRARLHPDVPDEEFLCFYPMSKRRDPEQNWYDLPFEERAEHIERHGNIGREYGGDVNQMICGSIGFDDWEWGITLWSEDMRSIKRLLTEMRFDPSTSKFAEFGPFYVGRKFDPEELPAVLSGQRIPSEDGVADEPHESHSGDRREHNSDHRDHSGDHPSGESDTNQRGGRPDVSGDFEEQSDMDERLDQFSLDDYEDGQYALLYQSTADASELADDVTDLAGNFDHYDRHVLTTIKAKNGQSHIISIWTAKEAAETAAGFLGDLDGIEEQFGGPIGETTASESDSDGASSQTAASDQSIRAELDSENVYAGQPHGEDVYALVVYSEADAEELADAVTDLNSAFDRYDTHVRTTVYAGADSETTAVASLWETEDAATTASEHLADLPDITHRHGDSGGFGTMGMFYTVKPDHRDAFVEKFDTVGGLLADMDGHRETTLLANHDDQNDMFIASQWDSKEDAMAFFRSDEFAETVDWGRDVLADRPRHVFLA
jgi:chlorite dismutase